MSQALSPARASLALLRGAYPTATITAETVQAYEAALADLDGQDVLDAVTILVKESKFMPTIAEIRETVAESKLRLPTPSEAWHEAQQRSFGTWDLPRHLLVTKAIEMMGGTYSIKTSETPSITQSQFIKHYSSLRADVIAGFVRSGEAPPGDLVGYVTLTEVMQKLETRDRLLNSPDFDGVLDEPLSDSDFDGIRRIGA